MTTPDALLLAAGQVAGALTALADRIATGGPNVPTSMADLDEEQAAWLSARIASGQVDEDLLRVLDVEAWLRAVGNHLSAIRSSLRRSSAHPPRGETR